MSANLYEIEIRIRDRVGVVNEVAAAMQRAGIPIVSHQARVIRERNGAEISVFRGKVQTDETGLRDLQRRLTRIRGFRKFTKVG